MLKIGCCEQVLDVPLFAELYGYGPFAGRRNRGIHDPLYCRAVTFSDGEQRALIVYTDTCVTADLLVQKMRARLASLYCLDPNGVAFVATHTHSAPLLGDGSIGSGERNPGFEQIWENTVIKAVGAALADEEEIIEADAGKSPLAKPLGKNRVEPDKNVTDPAIRWVRFRRADGSAKLLIHNHGIHGVASNGNLYRSVSADWMGAANKLIRDRGVVQMPLFLLGPAGDINTVTSCRELGTDNAAEQIAEAYVNDLENDLQNGKKVDVSKIAFKLWNVEFPTISQNAEELRKDAEVFRSFAESYWNNNADRLEEMAILAGCGRDLGVRHDLQILRIGELMFFFVPGELYIEPGMELMKQSGSDFPFVATVSNGNGAYLFTEASALRYPDIASKSKQLFGYYELYGYMHSLRFKYRNDIAAFVINQFLQKKDF